MSFLPTILRRPWPVSAAAFGLLCAGYVVLAGTPVTEAIAAQGPRAVVELFTPPRGPDAAAIRSRTTVHITGYGDDELFVGGRPATTVRPDVTVELSDWSMSTRHQARVAAALTPRLVELFDTEPDAINLRFHPYPPTDFAVGGILLSSRIPRLVRMIKRLRR